MHGRENDKIRAVY